jgi:hypothetical protein
MNGKDAMPWRTTPKTSSVLHSSAARRMFVLRMLRDRALAAPARSAPPAKSA